MFRTLRNSTRLLRIAAILAQHNVLFFWRGEADSKKGKRLARALKQMGPTFVKLGQVLSTRSDLVGQDVALELAGLQDRMPPFKTATARAIVEHQLGKKLSELYATFEDIPAAAASIAQVHFATLHTGQEVAVKIVRPNVEEAFAKDISLFYWLAGLAEYWRPGWQRFHLREVVEMFDTVISMELDLRYEAAAAVELRANLIRDKEFYVPEIYWSYTAQHVLTLERVYGIPISDVAALKAAGHDPVKLVDNAAVGFFRQVFRDGFFHADLHPGNLFVMADSTLAVVDFGIMGRLDRKNRVYLAQILHGFLTEDYYNLAKVHFDAGFVPAHKSVDNFAMALMAITKPIIGRKLSDISVARLLGQLFTTAENFEMEVQPQLLLLQKNMMITEGVGRMLNPDVNMWQVAEPLIREWTRDNLNLRNRFKEHAQEGLDMLKTLPALIKDAEAAVARVSDGGLKLHPETVAAIQAQRKQYHREWLYFAWAALIVFVLVHIA